RLPRWAPHGRALAFVRDGRLHVSPADHPVPRRLCDLEATIPVWSPDGREIVFASPEPAPSSDRPRVVTRAWQKADGQSPFRPSHVQVCDLDGRTRRLSDAFDITPAWSPDGRRIAFARMRGEGFTLSDLWSCDPDGRDARQITREVTRAKCPSWSPD